MVIIQPFKYFPSAGYGFPEFSKGGGKSIGAAFWWE
jgi:hypothetical protein